MSGRNVRVCATGDVASGTAKRFDVDGLRLCVVRLGDDWYVIGDRCSHEDYSLAEGDVWEDECEIECPNPGEVPSTWQWADMAVLLSWAARRTGGGDGGLQ